jgi:5-formyltetrahydrofolate cyclo-ligase
LLELRNQFDATTAGSQAQATLIHHLAHLLPQLEPQTLGLYWPLTHEFNPAAVLQAGPGLAKLPIALPFARRTPKQMEYRAWDGRKPKSTDECGIGTGQGAAVLPDVVLVPCVGFTASGFRLGYFDAQPHDKPLTLIVTEQGVL